MSRSNQCTPIWFDYGNHLLWPTVSLAIRRIGKNGKVKTLTLITFVIVPQSISCTAWTQVLKQTNKGDMRSRLASFVSASNQ